jgi:hypothetical protein
MRAFVRLRALLSSDKELAEEVVKLKRGHETHDAAIAGIWRIIHQLLKVPQTRAIGFFELGEKNNWQAGDGRLLRSPFVILKTTGFRSHWKPV